MEKKNVLIIAYLFPPIGGGGVQRALKMAKYLGRYGCKVSVLTVHDPRHISLDQSLLEEVPKNVAIHRAMEQKIPGMGAGVATPRGNEGESSNVPEPLVHKMIQKAKPMLKKVKEAILIPDDQITWYSDAVKLGEQIIKQQNIDVIFSTSGPYTNHLVGKQLKKLTGVKWIADFRDPWTQNMHRPSGKYRLKREEKMEREVIEKSDILMTVTHSFADNFKEKYGKTIKRLEVIHNGFDPEDYEHLQEEKLFPEKWTFVYTGIFYEQRNPRLFLESVSELIAEESIEKEKVSLQFAGVFDYPGYTENQDAVENHGLQDVVHLWGNLPHKKALAILAGADQLLLIGDVTSDSGAYIPGKLFEYMAVSNPIFALTVEGESARIIREQQLGAVIPPFDKEQIKNELRKSYQEWLTYGRQKLESKNTLKYQRDEQARLLAEVIHTL
ncbi:glycosyltransferase family 4 protein [Evansella sp. AB-rgal1]|uniref:glycosyltransferase family 4 protein n=1 Tax=Evansella sp. AB-rgal1 TaxID=3242696 RepID=UPI00359CCEB0